MKDALIKSLEVKLSKVTDDKVKEALKSKIDILKANKTVLKW